MTGRTQGWVAGACVALVALIVAGMFWPALSSVWEDPAEYHLRELKWHGRESKDGRQQRYHADRLIALGPRATPCLLREAIAHGGFGERFEPRIAEMLRAMGPPAHAAVVQELAAPEIAPATDSMLKTPAGKRSLLIGVLIEAFDDWSCFEEWLVAVHESPDGYIKSQQCTRMAWHVREKFGEAPPLSAIGETEGATLTTNPAFLAWWREAGKRRQEAARTPPP